MAYLFLGSNKITLADFGYKYIYMFIYRYNFIRSLTLFLSEIQSKTMSFHDIRGIHRKIGLHWQELESYQRSIKLNKKSETKLRTCIYFNFKTMQSPMLQVSFVSFLRCHQENKFQICHFSSTLLWSFWSLINILFAHFREQFLTLLTGQLHI